MGFFTNTGALKEGEIVLSSDHRHLYRIMEGKFVELKKKTHFDYTELLETWTRTW